MKVILSVTLWISVYLMLVLAPLLILMLGEMPPGSGFWWDFSMALGFAAMAMMGVQFLRTALELREWIIGADNPKIELALEHFRSEYYGRINR